MQAQLAARALTQIVASAMRGDWRRSPQQANDSLTQPLAVSIVVDGDAGKRVAVIIQIEPLARLYQISGCCCPVPSAVDSGMNECDGRPQQQTDVLVGFRLREDSIVADQVEVDIAIDTCETAVAVWPPTSLAIMKEDVLVPACMGRTVVIMRALRGCTGLRVGVRPAEVVEAVSEGMCPVVAVCAKLRNELVVAAVEQNTYVMEALPVWDDLACPSITWSDDQYYASRVLTTDNVSRAVVLLPDLDWVLDNHPHSCRLRAAADRARLRCDATFRELVEAVWKPDRVARGFVEPLDVKMT